MDRNRALAFHVAMEICGGELHEVEEAHEVEEEEEVEEEDEEVVGVEVVLVEGDPEESSSKASDSELEELEVLEASEDLEEEEDEVAAFTEW